MNLFKRSKSSVKNPEFETWWGEGAKPELTNQEIEDQLAGLHRDKHDRKRGLAESRLLYLRDHGIDVSFNADKGIAWKRIPVGSHLNKKAPGGDS